MLANLLVFNFLRVYRAKFRVGRFSIGSAPCRDIRFRVM